MRQITPKLRFEVNSSMMEDAVKAYVFLRGQFEVGRIATCGPCQLQGTF